MTVSAAIERGLGSGSGASQGGAPSLASAGLGAPSAGGRSLIGKNGGAPATESFRAGLQSMLASLGASASPAAGTAPLTATATPLSSVQVASALIDFTESGAIDTAAVAAPPNKFVSGNSAAIVENGKGLPLTQAAGSSSGQAEIVQLPTDKEQIGTLVNRTAAWRSQPVLPPPSSKTEEKKSVSSKSDAAPNFVASNSGQAIAQGELPAAIATLTPIAPAPPVPVTKPQSTPEQTATTDLLPERADARQQSGGRSASSSAALANDPRSSAPANLPTVSPATESDQEVEITPQAEPISAPSNLVAHSSVSASAIAAANAQEEALPTVKVHSEGSQPLPLQRTEQLQSQSPLPHASESRLSPAQPAVASNSAETLTLSPPSAPSTPLAESTVEPLAQGVRPHSPQSATPGLNALPATTINAGVNPATTDAAAIQGIAVLQPVLPEDAAAIPSTNLASGGKSSAVGSSKAVRGVGGVAAHQLGGHPATQPSSGAGVDAAAITRDLSGGRGGATPASETARNSIGITSGPDSREVFATLDTENPTGRPTWIHAGAQQAEAGFQDPTLGWVGVRADASGGGVHAELVAGSADAAQALGGHMAGLNAYLADHHTPVESLSLTSSDGGRTGGDPGSAGQSMQQGAGQQSGQQAGQGTSQDVDLRLQASSFPERSAPSTVSSGLPSEILAMNGSTQSTGQAGLHISVMA